MKLKDLEGAVGRRDSIAFDPRVIVVEKGHNPRNYDLPENRQHLNELKASIKEHGVLSPIWIRQDGERAILVDGECRLRATLELIDEGEEIKSIPTLSVRGANEADRLILALTANTGKPLSKWEVGKAYIRLIGFGWSEETIASRMGQSPRYIKEAIELSDASEEVKQLLSEAAVTPSLAIQHIRKSGSGASITLKAAVEEAKSAGSKGPAKRKKSDPLVSLRSASESILKEWEDAEEGDFEYISISVKSLNKLKKAMK